MNMNDRNNFYVFVCHCLFIAIQLHGNFKLYCFYFFQNLNFQVGGAAYTRTFTVD